MQWRLLVLLTGLILDPTHVPEDDDDIITNMRMREGQLQQEGANLVLEPEAATKTTTLKDHPESHSDLQVEDQDLGRVKTPEPHQPELQVGESSSEENRFTEGETETKTPEPSPEEYPDTEDAEQSENEEPSGVSEEHSPQQEVVMEHQHHPPEEPEPEPVSQNEVDEPKMSENVESHEAEEETHPSQSDLSDPDMNSKASEDQGASHSGEKLSETEKQPSQSDVSDPDMNLKASEDQGAAHSGEKSSETEKQPSHCDVSDPGHTAKQPDSNVGIGTQKKPKQSQTSNNATDFMWHLLNIYSLFSVIAYLYKRLRGSSRDQETPEKPQHHDLQAAHHSISAEISVPDRETLTGFYEHYVHVAPHESRRVCEFVEGFVDDLLAAIRETSGRHRADLEVDDFVEVGSLYETWCTGRTLTCDLWVPVTPREPYSFQAQLSSTDQDGHADESDEVRSGFGRVKVREGEGGRGTANGCPCGQTGEDSDMLCLLHTHEKKEEKKDEVVDEVVDAVDAPLCCENTPYLSRTDVTRWFRSAVRKAWEQMSHKYELELTFQSRESPGALRIRFRSGKAVHFNVTPVVKFEGADVCLVSYLGPKRRDGEPAEAQQWPLSFARYEKNLLRLLGRGLPPDACHLRCLQILSFLHKTQVGITGESGLSSHHLKTALLRLLLDKAPSEWGPEHLAGRLRDALDLLKTSLQKRWLSHALVGNPLVPQELGLPACVCQSKPVNILQPLLSQGQLYTRTVQHFEEMLRNMPVLIQEYMNIPKKGNSSS